MGAHRVTQFGVLAATTGAPAHRVTQLGLLTATLANINPAVKAVQGDYTPRSSQNAEFVQAVAEMNVQLTMEKLHDRSVVLREMIDSGEIGLVGAMYDVSTGKVTFYE